MASRATERALVRPRSPKVLVPHGGSMRIEVNMRNETLVLYNHNSVELISHVSTGARCLPGQGCGWNTPTGNFRTIWFYRGWIQVPLGEMYNPVFFIGSTFAIHGELNTSARGIPTRTVASGFPTTSRHSSTRSLRSPAPRSTSGAEPGSCRRRWAGPGPPNGTTHARGLRASRSRPGPAVRCGLQSTTRSGSWWYALERESCGGSGDTRPLWPARRCLSLAWPRRRPRSRALSRAPAPPPHAR